MYQSNFKNEKNTTRTVFKAGWHAWRVDSIESKTAKSGNPMFLVTLSNTDTCQTIECYMVSVEGKQWLLSQFIKACGIVLDQDGNCSWNDTDVIDHIVSGFIQNEENNYINREGVEIKGERSQISNFQLMQVPQEQTREEVECAGVDIEEEVIIPGEEEMF